MERVDPGAGEPAAIRSLASARDSAAERLQRVRSEVVAAESAVSTSEWTGRARVAFTAAIGQALPDLELLVMGLRAQASALHSYAGQVQSIKDEQAQLEARRRTSRAALGRMEAEAPFASHQLYAATPDTDEARRARAGLRDAVAHENAVLRSLDAQWQQLVHRRRRLDGATASELGGPAVLGQVAALSMSAGKPTAASLFSTIVSLSATDLTILLKHRPELSQIIAAAEPSDVAAWWGSLSSPGGAQSASQLALLAAIPVVMGSLNGLPAGARVLANMHNARTQIEKDEKLIEKYKDYGTTVKRLQREIDYLKGAVAESPTVQLYLYDPPASRIVEMIGTPSADTEHVITYVPGTFTNLASFYNTSAQQIARDLVESRSGDAVAFVYKDGVFPAASDNSDSLDFVRFPEANHEPRALAAGRQLADFHATMLLDPDLGDSRTAAIGHSWGLAAVSSSEVAGARYDKVFSLSGAGMPSSWTPIDDTKYIDLSYPDSLQEMQILGGDLVWGGNVPRAGNGFSNGPYYEGPEDAFRRLPDGTPYGVKQDVLADNHNLVATSKSGNQTLLGHLREKLFEESTESRG